MSLPVSAADPDVPLISVVMSVYNGAATVADAVQSILSQTVADFEFIIIDDGSSDASPDILSTFAAQDKRIILVRQNNMGLTKSLNKGVSLARGTYIARQDADDISYPTRFEKQLLLFENDAEVVLAGGVSDDVHDNGLQSVWPYHDDQKIQSVVFFKTPFPHSTAMFRTDAYRTIHGYDERYKTSQDMELWMRFAKQGRLAMVAEPILKRRIGSGSISVKRRWRQFYDSACARLAHGPDKIAALYHSARAIIIALLPPRFIQYLKAA